MADAVQNRPQMFPVITPSLTLNASQPPRAVLQGDWVAAAFAHPRHGRRVLAQLKATNNTAVWDLRPLGRLDHIGAQVLWHHWGHAWPAQLECDTAQRAMLERIAQYADIPLPATVERQWTGAIHHLGALVLHALGHARHVVELLGQLLLDLLRLLRQPRRGPWRDISGHLYHMGTTALPITALVGLLIGVVLAYLMSLQLRQFGAETFIVNILGISLIRELGPMLGAILVAGRSGSAITAQIGVMRVTEELDAMRVMGIAHGFRLVLPRALALALAMPLVALWTTLAALTGGMLAADVALGISPSYFVPFFK